MSQKQKEEPEVNSPDLKSIPSDESNKSSPVNSIDSDDQKSPEVKKAELRSKIMTKKDIEERIQRFEEKRKKADEMINGIFGHPELKPKEEDTKMEIKESNSGDGALCQTNPIEKEINFKTQTKPFKVEKEKIIYKSSCLRSLRNTFEACFPCFKR